MFIDNNFVLLQLADVFGRYDYGPVTNLDRYNSTEPPAYDLTSIRVPVMLMYGKNDLVADVQVRFSRVKYTCICNFKIYHYSTCNGIFTQDVMRLKSQLPRLIDAVMIDNPYCNHVDFMWSLKVNEHVNDPVKETLRKTDDVDWKYSGPNPSKDTLDVGGNVSAGYIGGSGNISISEDIRIAGGNISGSGAPLNLDYIAKNLGRIIRDIMPMSMEGDAADFKQERELQETLLADAIEFVRLVQKKYFRSTYFLFT